MQLVTPPTATTAHQFSLDPAVPVVSDMTGDPPQQAPLAPTLLIAGLWAALLLVRWRHRRVTRRRNLFAALCVALLVLLVVCTSVRAADSGSQAALNIEAGTP